MAANPFREFVLQFCAAFAVPVTKRGGRMVLSFPPELAAHFGREELVASFTPHDPEGELVAYGSRVFEEMLAYMGGAGRMAAVRLPIEHRELPEPTLAAGELVRQGDREEVERRYALNFQLAFVCDERIEQLFSVGLDERGREVPAELEGLVLDDQPAGQLPVDVARWAEERAIAAAEAWSRPLEAAALERLQAVGARLVAFYEAQMNEVYPRKRKGQSEEESIAEAEELRWQLRRELERKLRDETARHQMRVQVRRISQAVIEQPRHRVTYRLAHGRAAREIDVVLDQYGGTVSWPPCERCGKQDGHYGLCMDGHLACETCLGGCATCGEARCQAELAACATCGLPGCQGCRVTCANGHAGCAGHLAPCPGCGMALCPACERPHGCGLA